jgi:hypothetical protein
MSPSPNGVPVAGKMNEKNELRRVTGTCRVRAVYQFIPTGRDLFLWQALPTCLQGQPSVRRDFLIIDMQCLS